MTFSEIVKMLADGGVEDSSFEAAELICHFERVSRAAVRFGDYSSSELLSAIERRIAGEPLQYIIGEWDFFGYTFKVSPACLIPRADTELLCEYVCKNAPLGARIADLCTGSGCIAIAALLERPDLFAVAVELYPETLELARENARLLGVSDRIEFILGDATEDILTGEFDVIASNPPYVTLEEMRDITREVEKEPRHALTDGGDGLSIIRKIIEHSPRHLKEGGSLAIEFGWKQGNAMIEIANENGLFCKILQDIEGRDRVAVIKKTEEKV